MCEIFVIHLKRKDTRKTRIRPSLDTIGEAIELSGANVKTKTISVWLDVLLSREKKWNERKKVKFVYFSKKNISLFMFTKLWWVFFCESKNVPPLDDFDCFGFSDNIFILDFDRKWARVWLWGVDCYQSTGKGTACPECNRGLSRLQSTGGLVQKSLFFYLLNPFGIERLFV